MSVLCGWVGGYAIMHLSVFEKENTMKKRERENAYWWTIDKVKGRLCVQRHDTDRESKDIELLRKGANSMIMSQRFEREIFSVPPFASPFSIGGVIFNFWNLPVREKAVPVSLIQHLLLSPLEISLWNQLCGILKLFLNFYWFNCESKLKFGCIGI